MLNRIKNLPRPDFNLAFAPLRRKSFWLCCVLAVGAYSLYQQPPFASVGAGEVVVWVNQFSGDMSQWTGGNVLVLPLIHQVQHFSLRDQVYHPQEMQSASGNAPLQSIEGLSFGLDLQLRYALDAKQIEHLVKNGPADIRKEIVEPAVQGVVYKTFARYTVREIFSSKRAEIQQLLEQDIKARLAKDGVILRHLQIGKVDLPAEYRRGMESLLAEELASEKMRYTLELKEKQVKQTALEAQADKARRETEAEAAGREQIIAAKAQEEAMKHVLPFKERQIQQRQLEAEADKVARIRGAEASAEARQIEAQGEAAARQKLADAEVYRSEQLGKVNAVQMEREGELVTKHPLLIQKTLADKLSDKVQVIIASPGHNDFIGANLLGMSATTAEQ